MQNPESRIQNPESVLVCFALKEEAAPFRKIAAGGLRRSHHILITGIGKKNTEKSVREFLAGRASVLASHHHDVSTRQDRLAGTLALPKLVLSCGFAGGLNPDLKLGDVLFEIGNRKSEIGNRLTAAGAKRATFFCADRVATTAAEKKKLRKETGADAVEMESGAIHAICRERGIPCATVRVISDTASEDLPLDFNTLARPDMSLDYGKLFWTVAKSPGKIGRLLRSQKRCRFAAEQLAGVLVKITFP